jgi:hypothetical protein
MNPAPPTSFLLRPPGGKFPYGWDREPLMVQVKDDHGELLVDIHGKPLMEVVEGEFIKKFTHPFRTIIQGASKRGPRFANITPTTKRQIKRHSETKPTRYIVMSDHSLRRLDKVLIKAVEQMSPEQLIAFDAANAKGAQ